MEVSGRGAGLEAMLMGTVGAAMVEVSGRIVDLGAILTGTVFAVVVEVSGRGAGTGVPTTVGTAFMGIGGADVAAIGVAAFKAHFFLIGATIP